jgi:glyoxylase-like metal-dependent hydrolase (beta-lactamase superfamily II)
MQNQPSQSSAVTRLGDAGITIVSDGIVTFPVDFVYGSAPAEEVTALRSAFGQSPDTQTLQSNVMVADIAGRRVMVDAGGGGKFQPANSGLPANLRAAGIDPESIDLVVFTHLHPDHFWGATDEDNAAPSFPNAELIAPQLDHAFWSQPGLDERMPNEFAAWITRTTQAHLEQVAGRIRIVGPDDVILDGIRYIPTPGHTPGHASLLIEQGDDALLVVGDVLTDPVVSFERPEWAAGYDADGGQAAATRQDLLERLARERLRALANHLPWPGLGHVARHEGRYRWVPANWAV